MKNIHLSAMEDMLRAVTRRHFFKQAGFGIGAAALSSLLNRYAFASGLSSAAAKPAAGAGGIGVSAGQVRLDSEAPHE